MSDYTLPLNDELNMVGIHDLVGIDMGMEDLGNSLSPRMLAGASTGSSGNPYSNGEEEEEFEKLQADYTNVGDGDDEDGAGATGIGGGVVAGGLRGIPTNVGESKAGTGMGMGVPSGSRDQQRARVQSVSNGKKRARMDDDPSPTEDEDAPSMVPGTIFKNAFNAADVEADDDEDDDEEEGPSSKRAKSGPSGGATSDGGHPGGFQLVSKDGDPMRRKIRIEYIADKSRRHITFSKRKSGIMKKAYELSILTGVQLMLLVVSETGLVYTFTTAKLQPIVKQPEGMNLIQACLNAPEGVGPDGTPTSIAAIPTVKKDRKTKDKDGLAIRPLKLDAASIQNLENSASAAGHGSGVPAEIAHPSARPRKRLPSGKAKKPIPSKRAVSNTGLVPSSDPINNQQQQDPYGPLSSPTGPTSINRQDLGQGMPNHSPLSAAGPSHSPHGIQQHQTGGMPLSYPHQQQGHQSQHQSQSQQHEQHSQPQPHHPYYGGSGMGVQPQMMGGMVSQQSNYYQAPLNHWNVNGAQDGIQSEINQHYEQQHLQPQQGFHHQQRHVSNNAMDVSGM